MQAVVEQPRRAPAPRALHARAAYLDNLKVALVAAIIAVHGVVGYSSWEGAWAYEPAAEVRLAPVTENVLGGLVLPVTLFAMGLFFMMSGLVTPGSLMRKGPRRFARDRLVRLGIPLVVWTFGIWPAVVYVAHRVAGDTASYRSPWPAPASRSRSPSRGCSSAAPGSAGSSDYRRVRSRTVVIRPWRDTRHGEWHRPVAATRGR